MTIRAPIPWRNSYQSAFEFCSENLFVTSQNIRDLQSLWQAEFYDELFFNLEEGLEKPMVPQDFIQFVSDQADSMREKLVSQWVPKCAEIVQQNFFQERKNFVQGEIYLKFIEFLV